MKVSYLLAHRGLARTFAPKWGGELRPHTYQDFFAIWKDADVELPIFI